MVGIGIDQDPWPVPMLHIIDKSIPDDLPVLETFGEFLVIDVGQGVETGGRSRQIIHNGKPFVGFLNMLQGCMNVYRKVDEEIKGKEWVDKHWDNSLST